ncbi:hypothetical protein ABZZ36_00570 [Actinacidiphila glaucinigra]|uniref:hypothetical protein n=1 Tax=Actinacidiphila glaucinigra TaxID=235986 RepID=UPI0033AA603F
MELRKVVVAATVTGVALLVTGAAAPPPPHPAASSGLAGSESGEGRRHPGRAEPPQTTPGAGEDRSSAPLPVRVQEPQDQGPAAVRAPVGRVLEVLPLGVGLVLIGLGLGFLGLRLRRGR